MRPLPVELLPLEGIPEVRPGDDLAELLAVPIAGIGPRDGDVVAVTQKVVSKSEGRVVPDGEGRATWVERETERVVARRDELVIVQTRHGLVCANAGVDASNVEGGFLTLLPTDPDGSAERLRAGLVERFGVHVAVVVTDTFGRAWRRGVVNVAIGAAGLPSIVDLRGTADHHGRELEATMIALADEIAAASGLVMGKAARVPAAIVRGLPFDGPSAPASELIRPPEEDLFRTSPLLSISERRTISSFGPGEVPRGLVEEAVRAACTAPAPHQARPWVFTAIWSRAAKRRLLEGIANSDTVLEDAPVLVVPWINLDVARPHPDAGRADTERDRFLLSGGAAVENLLLALHAQGLASCWVSSTMFAQRESREALGMDRRWTALGVVAVGPMPARATAPPRPPLDLSEHLRVL